MNDIGDLIDAHIKQKGAISLSTADGYTFITLTTETLRALLVRSEEKGSVILALKREVPS